MPSPLAPLAASSAEFSFRRIAVPAFGPSPLFGLGEGAILPAALERHRHGGVHLDFAQRTREVELGGVDQMCLQQLEALLLRRRCERRAASISPKWTRKS